MTTRAVGWMVAAILALGGTARAQGVPPPADSATPAPEASAGQTADLARLEALLQSHASEARTARLTFGSVAVATGLAAVPVGIVAQTSWNQQYGIGLWVTGALLLGFGTVSLVVETPLEVLDQQFRAAARTLSPADQLAFGVGGLASVASGARTSRLVGAISGLVLAGVFFGVAIGEWVAAGNAVGSDKNDKQANGATALVLGGLFCGGATAQLVLPSPAETAYAAYLSGQGTQRNGVQLSAGFVPLRGGGMVGVGGAF